MIGKEMTIGFHPTLRYFRLLGTPKSCQLLKWRPSVA